MPVFLMLSDYKVQKVGYIAGLFVNESDWKRLTQVLQVVHHYIATWIKFGPGLEWFC